MKGMGLTLFFAATLFAANANAQAIQGLSQELNTDAAKLPGLNQTMSETTDANLSLAKESKVYRRSKTKN